MDEKLAKKINRQLQAIKVVLVFFVVMLAAVIAILGFLAWKVLSFTNSVNNRLDNFQQKTEQTLNLKDDLCKDNVVSGFLKQNSDVCKDNE